MVPVDVSLNNVPCVSPFAFNAITVPFVTPASIRTTFSASLDVEITCSAFPLPAREFAVIRTASPSTILDASISKTVPCCCVVASSLTKVPPGRQILHELTSEANPSATSPCNVFSFTVDEFAK